MGFKINYEDDIFLLNSLIKTLQKGLNLDVDPDFFRQKILDDIFFIDSSLTNLFASLCDSEFLIARRQYLRDLQRTIAFLIDIMDGILDEKYRFAAQLRSAFIKIKACRLQLDKMITDIRSMLTDATPEDEHEDTVSQDEFRFLLKPDQETDE